MHTYFKLKTWPYQNFNYRNYKSTLRTCLLLPPCSTGLKKVIQIVPELNRFKFFNFSPLNHNSGNMAWFLHNVAEHTNKRQRSHIQLGEGITPEPKLHDVRFRSSLCCSFLTLKWPEYDHTLHFTKDDFLLPLFVFLMPNTVSFIWSKYSIIL